MIWDSVVWKQALNKELIRTENAISKRRIHSGYLDFQVEQFYFLSAYIIRKLLEARKLSSEVCAQDTRVKVYAYIGGDGVVDYFNFHHIRKLYDLGACPE